MTFPTARISRLAQVTLGKMLQSAPQGPDDVEAEYLRAAHIQPGGVLASLEPQPMWFNPIELKTLSLRAGDVCVVEGGAGYGRSAYLDHDIPKTGFQNSIVRIRPRMDRANGRFVNWLFTNEGVVG